MANAKQKKNCKGNNCKSSSKRTNARFASDDRKKRSHNKLEGSENNKFKEEDSRGNTSGSNSTDWYGGSSQLMQNAASISFHTGVGRTLRLLDDNGNATEITPAGIMVFTALNTPGLSRDWNSPINLASRQLYTYVRHVNAGHSNYDAVDLMMYMMLMDNAFSYHAWMVRVYGTMRTILLRNKYTPVALVRAMGVEYEDIASKMADFRYYINLYATRINQMAVPDTMPIFKRHMWMYSNIYADAALDKAQFYLFNPYAFWKYNVTESDRTLMPSVIVPTAYDYSPGIAGRWNLANIVSIGDTMINQVLQTEDFNIMSGDIMKAFGDKLFKLQLIGEDYNINPVYDPEILLQIHNANVLGRDRVNTLVDEEQSWHIRECVFEGSNAGALVFDPYLRADNFKVKALCTQRLMDVPLDDPKSDIIAAATRFMIKARSTTTFTDELDNTPMIKFDTFGTEVLMRAYLFTISSNNKTTYDGWSKEDFVNSDLQKLVHFEQRPLTYHVTGTTLNNAKVDNVSGDLTNFTAMDADSLQNINEAATLALFGIV